MNSTDYYPLENISDLKINEFLSIKYNDTVWGFNIISIYNLFIKSRDNIVLNPYIRERLHYSIFDKINRLIRLSKI